MQYRDVELTDGRTVRVYPPPTIKIEAILARKYPDVQAPVVTERTKSGTEISMEITTDPEYLRKKAEVEANRDAEREELNWLFVLRGEEPPSDWDIERDQGEIIRYSDPDWKPRKGKVGKKLDYIEWDILADVGNASRITDSLRDMAGIDQEVVAQVTETFPDQVEGEES
jgi:hypothetical protein